MRDNNFTSLDQKIKLEESRSENNFKESIFLKGAGALSKGIAIYLGAKEVINGLNGDDQSLVTGLSAVGIYAISEILYGMSNKYKSKAESEQNQLNDLYAQQNRT